MRVLLAGATGTFGGPLIRALRLAHHDVVALVRSREGERQVRALDVDEVIIADAMKRDELLRAASEIRVDAVMHQLTALRKAPVRHGHMKGTDALRTQGSTHLLEAARVAGASRMLTQSIVFGYGYRDHGDAIITERSPFGEPGSDAFAPHVAAMRSAEDQVFAAPGIDGIALRYGLFYGAPEDTASAAAMLHKRALPVARHGGLLAFVHHDDAAAGTVAALERGADGAAYNIVDDTPATFAELTTAIAVQTESPKPLRLPGGLLRTVAPYGGAVLSRVSMRVSNARARVELGWAPRYPSYREGLHG